MKLFRYILSYVALSMFLPACTTESEDNTVESTQKDEVEFTVQFAGRMIGYDETDSELEDLSGYFIKDKSCVLISQRGSSLAINFDEESNNCYKYVYYENNGANWEEGYNFRSVDPLSWEKIISNGQFGSGYAFGALYYPGGNSIGNYVNKNQNNEDTFNASDILGAWHRTINERERLRFQLNHLMCCLHVELYVPDWDDESSTGFYKEALQEAKALSFRTDFNIEWPDNSSEEPPLAKPAENVPGTVSDIVMYVQDPDPDDPEVIENFDVSLFNIPDQTTDRVRKYSLYVLFPQQSKTGNLLGFSLERAGSIYNYAFNSAYITDNSNGFAFTHGWITRLRLYIPRADNDILLVGANILKWDESQASFTITKDENKE